MLAILSTVIIIVLGCHIKDIQTDRIQTAIELSQKFENQTSDSQKFDSQIWFLTGGVKNDIYDTISSDMNEANQMKEFLFLDSNIIIDTEAVNTAENFLNFKKWYQHADFVEHPQIVITTSSFHKGRAEKIFKGIFHDIKVEPVWNLSQSACPTCWSDELIHIRNVDSDIKKALEKQ